MKEVIDRIFKRTTEYSHPSQATTIANSLELLSSGIYTEEERFVFELLQNAVDSYDGDSNGLDVRIIVGNGQLVFMHTGKPFSERDLEGLCDIGNGNKMTDAKKIGYKGIGFKSVFMHSKRVTVITGNSCFRFDEEVCKQLASQRGSSYQDVKMPWQIIPILSDIPEGLDYDAYNVTTVLEVSNTEKLLKKVEKLLSDARFLLFLKVANLRVSLFKDNREILSLSKTQKGNILTLAKNDVAQSRWLMFAKDVEIPDDVKEDLIHDAKTPAKLKDSDSVEISFAIALDDNGKIEPLKDAVVYTYLPTSFSFGFEFVVNANFITDAGRQQLIKDCEWNKFIFSRIPELFLNWIKDEVAPNHEDWYKVLLPLKDGLDDLSRAYASNLKLAIQTVPFIRSTKKRQCLISNSIFDKYSLHKSLPHDTFMSFVKNEFNILGAYDSIVPVTAGAFLSKYKICTIDKSRIQKFIEKSALYLRSFSEEDNIQFLIWLKESVELHSDTFFNLLSYASILPCEDGDLHEPRNVFFPSEFREAHAIAKDAVVLNSTFYQSLPLELKSWLKVLGVQEMSPLSIIESVLCKDGYIVPENAIEVLRYVFKFNQKENIFATVAKSKLSNLKILTTKGSIKNASQLYLSDIYNPKCRIQTSYNDDIFVSEDYMDSDENVTEWSLFLTKLGVSDDIKLSLIKYEEGSWLTQNSSIRNVINKAKSSEYNTAWDGRKFYLGCAGGTCVYAKTSVFIKPKTEYTILPSLEFYSNIWSRIFTQQVPGFQDDYVFGNTGYGYTKKAYLDTPKYLNMTFLDWVTKNLAIIPATDGQLHNIQEVLLNTDNNLTLFGKYYPVILLNNKISQQWAERLTFKKELSLLEMLEVLSKISADSTKEQIKDNIDRICRIYDRITDGDFNLSEGSGEYNVLHNWGKTHKILSSDKNFEFPCDLCLISSRITGVELDNQVYHRKSQENDRFASLMIALGVNMITEHRVEGLEYAVSQASVKESLINKREFFAALTLNGETSKQKWDEAVEKMQASISAIRFYSVPSIQVIYGNQSIEKAVYVSNSDLYFVGKFGLAVQELLHGDIVRLIGLHKNDSSTFLTLLRMSDFDEMIEYLQFKGYETSYISRNQLPVRLMKDPSPSIKGENLPYGGLTKEQMGDALTEAKEAILKQLETDGYDISNYQWDGWTCIDGVTKDGKEYPLVIRSNKSSRNTVLSASDWDQLMKENAMFVVNTNSGIGTVNFKQLLKSKDNITIRFGSENIDDANRISKLAEAFAFFKGIQFDFESYIRPTISRWESFMAPELETGEQAEANPSIPLPE